MGRYWKPPFLVLGVEFEMQEQRAFRILLIEDNPVDVLLFQRALDGVGLQFELNVLDNGGAALQLFNEQVDGNGSPVPDLIILDLMLPKADGGKVLGALRQSQRFTGVPVVVASSATSSYQRDALAHLGVKEYLVKPMQLRDYDQIGAVLKNILRQHEVQ
jgi:CheY-like chemotaxis protein